MNFLAHLVLAPDTPEGMVGALAPDLVRGPLPSDLHPAVLDAAREHQHIDRVTDAHPAFLGVRERLRPGFDRFAGIVADVLFDHALASQWDGYRATDETLTDYAQRVGATLTRHPHLIPQRMRQAISMMTGQGWLPSYATAGGIRLTLGRMSRRFSERLGTAVDLASAADLLTPQAGWLVDAFDELWPDLRAAVAGQRGPDPVPVPAIPPQRATP